MAQNTAPIFTLTPNVGFARITQASANVKSDGAGTVGTDIFLLFTAGTNGSYIERIRFSVTASAAATVSVPTTLRVFLSTLNTGTTAPGNTWLVAEISVPALTSDHSTISAPFYEVNLSMAIPTGLYVLVSQHVAQTANQSWIAAAIGGDY